MEVELSRKTSAESESFVGAADARVDVHSVTNIKTDRFTNLSRPFPTRIHLARRITALSLSLMQRSQRAKAGPTEFT